MTKINDEADALLILPRTKAFHISYYPKYEPEFYDLMSDCARYIDKMTDVDEKITYTNHLSRIFIIRHKDEAMKLLKKLAKKKGGYHHG